MDDGGIRTFTGYRIVHSRIRGPAKGGLRFHPEVTEDEVRGAGLVDDLQVRGRRDPLRRREGRRHLRSQGVEQERAARLTRRYVAELGDCIGPYSDIPAPDVGTDSETMGWVYDTYQMMHPGSNSLPAVTGKPVDLGGIPGRREATGLGSLLATRRALTRGVVAGLSSLDGAKVVVQGFGNAGSVAARLFHGAGARIVGLSDSQRRNRQSPRARPRGRRASQPGDRFGRRLSHARAVTNAELLRSECDILIPAALENQITHENAGQRPGPADRRMANGPDHAGRRRSWASRGFRDPRHPGQRGRRDGELLRVGAELRMEQSRAEDVRRQLEEKMEHATTRSSTNSRSCTSDLRTAAYVLALGRIGQTAIERGIWPRGRA